MRITLNGKDEMLSKQELTITGLLALKNINPATVVVEYNYKVAPRETWPEICLQEGDRLEILHLVGGG